MQSISPCLWFNGQAEEAANFYVSAFAERGARLVDLLRYTEAGPGPRGAVLAATFELEGQQFMALNGGPNFSFTPAISFFVPCDTQEDVDRMWARLVAGGQAMQCGWLSDRYGVSWQIVPRMMADMLRDPDEARLARVMRAMMKMVKLDIAELRAAYDG